MKLAGLVARDVTPTWIDCLAQLDATAPADYRELAALLACEWSRTRPRFVGLAGGQGAGKSTLGRLIESACDSVGLRTCVLGLDDFYLPRAERLELARTVHPLLETRGPPGTHDMVLFLDRLQRLLGVDDSKESARVELPVFDKGLDDRSGSRWVIGPFDLVVLEGWCVGAAAVDPETLEAPINALESEQDAEGGWRRFVNDRLGDEYARVWARLDDLVYLKVPDLEAVRRWRLQQEDARPATQRLDAEAIDRFVQYYERVTLSMMDSMSQRASLTVELAPDHSIAAARFRDGRSVVASTKSSRTTRPHADST